MSVTLCPDSLNKLNKTTIKTNIFSKLQFYLSAFQQIRNFPLFRKLNP